MTFPLKIFEDQVIAGWSTKNNHSDGIPGILGDCTGTSTPPAKTTEAYFVTLEMQSPHHQRQLEDAKESYTAVTFRSRILGDE